MVGGIARLQDRAPHHVLRRVRETRRRRIAMPKCLAEIFVMTAVLSFQPPVQSDTVDGGKGPVRYVAVDREEDRRVRWHMLGPGPQDGQERRGLRPGSRIQRWPSATRSISHPRGVRTSGRHTRPPLLIRQARTSVRRPRNHPKHQQTAPSQASTIALKPFRKDRESAPPKRNDHALCRR